MAATGSGGARRVFPPAPSTLHRTVGGFLFWVRSLVVHIDETCASDIVRHEHDIVQ